jgi:hypothetical protein
MHMGWEAQHAIELDKPQAHACTSAHSTGHDFAKDNSV